MIVSVDHAFEYAPETSSFLLDTKKLDEIDNFKKSYDGDLEDVDFDSVLEYRKMIKEELESEEDVVGWGYEDEKTHDKLGFIELVSGAEEEHPIRVIKNVTVFEG